MCLLTWRVSNFCIHFNRRQRTSLDCLLFYFLFPIWRLSIHQANRILLNNLKGLFNIGKSSFPATTMTNLCVCTLHILKIRAIYSVSRGLYINSIKISLSRTSLTEMTSCSNTNFLVDLSNCPGQIEHGKFFKSLFPPRYLKYISRKFKCARFERIYTIGN